MPLRRILVPLLAVLFLTTAPLLALAAPASRPLGETFPAEMFNGLHLTYTISGVELGSPVDEPGFTYNRAYTGRLTGDTLIVSGMAHAENGWSAAIDVAASADGTKEETFKASKAPKDGMSGDPMDQAFSVAVKIPPEATHAQFFIRLTGTYNAGGRAVLVTGSFSRPAPTPTLTPTPSTPQLLVEAEPLFLPADGSSISRITFTYLQGQEPQAGQNVAVSLSPAQGALDQTSVTTDSNGQATVTLTAPQLADLSFQQVTVLGQAPQAAAEVTIDLGYMEITDLGVYARADGAGKQISLEARVKSHSAKTLNNVPVAFYVGDPDAGGVLLGEQIIPSITTGEQVWSGGQGRDRRLIDWELGLLTDETLYVQVPVTGWTLETQPKRSFTIQNRGVPFALNSDAYAFVNPASAQGQAAWLEDALAVFLARESLSAGVQVLSYPLLLEDVLGQDEKFGSGHCEGMANSANSYFVQPDTMPAGGPVYGYQESDPAVRGNIILHQAYQLSDRFARRLPDQGSYDPDAQRLAGLASVLDKQFEQGQPVTLSMLGNQTNDPAQAYAHAVLAYQKVTVKELGLTRIMLYDSNRPYDALSDGIAAAASLRLGSQAFHYEDGVPYTKARLEWTPSIKADTGAAFVAMARDLAQSNLHELLSTSPPSRLITVRGETEPVLVTADGKRLGIVDGKVVREIPDATVTRYFGAYVFRLPGDVPVKANLYARRDGSISLGVAAPRVRQGRAPGGIYHFAALRTQAPAPDAADGQIGVFQFSQVPVWEGQELRLDTWLDQALLFAGDSVVPPTVEETLSLADLAAVSEQPAAPSRPAATWTDPLDGQIDTGAEDLPDRKTGQPIPPWRGVAWIPGSSGKAAQLVGDNAYVGYVGSRLAVQQGTILLRFKPAPDLVGIYATQHPGWTSLGETPPPAYGFMLDTVGWSEAAEGSFHLVLLPNDTERALVFGVVHGRVWHDVSWQAPADWVWDPGRWYEIGVSWGPKGMAILLDGAEVASVPDVVALNSAQPWFLGQAPWYEPFGPHTLPGAYDDVRTYDVQIGPEGTTERPADLSQAPAPLEPVEPREQVFVGSDDSWQGAYGGRRPPSVPEDDTASAAPRAVSEGSSEPEADEDKESRQTNVGEGLGTGDENEMGEVERLLENLLQGLVPASGPLADLFQRMRGRLSFFVGSSCCVLPLLLLTAIVILVTGRGRASRSRSRAVVARPATPVPGPWETSSEPDVPTEDLMPPAPVTHSLEPAAVSGDEPAPAPEATTAAEVPTAVSPEPTKPQGAAEPEPEHRFCEQCGSRLAPDARFCGRCGKPVSGVGF